MPGARQPTDVVKANGKKHLSTTEEEQRRDREVHVPPPEKVTPPAWFPKGKKLRAEYCEIGEILLAAGLFSELDRDVLAQYFMARERWLAADSEAAKAIKTAAKAEALAAKLAEKARKAARAAGADEGGETDAQADGLDDEESDSGQSDSQEQARAEAADAAKRAKDWASVQSTYFRQARQCAELMGLSVSARCRIQVPAAIVNAGKAAAAAPGEGEDEFTKLLTARQARAGAG